MSDPTRWLDEGGGATDEERALLRAARDVGPTARNRDAVWALLAAEVGAAGLAATAATKSRSVSTMMKIVVSALALGAVALLFFLLRAPKVPPVPVAPPPSVSVSVSAPASASVAPVQVDEHQPEEPKPEAPKVAKTAAPSVSASSSLASRLKEESELIARARDALHAGDYAKTHTLLDTLKTKFPNGVLIQERKALEIELLYRTGRRAEADAQAAAFLDAYPTSPHAARIRELAKP